MTQQERFTHKADQWFLFLAGTVIGAFIVMFIEAIPQ